MSNELGLIPIYIEAKSKDELVEKMLVNNHANSRKFNYMSPMREGKIWVVWFYADIENYSHPDSLDLPKMKRIGEMT